MRLLIVLVLLIAGCGVTSSPKPVIDDFSRDIVRVRVPYTSRGPQAEAAKSAAEEVARNYCRTLARKAAYASFFREKTGLLGSGKLYFVYRCAE
ncbi:MAG: hypothetical protein OXP66_11805 [Candidatus Tectomicrobia bacterium]|nr:hypothetical protein [Candidatus Tectomicrobia bacterium]